jgi:hypothetical protein
MNSEFPDQEQRMAVCVSLWENKSMPTELLEAIRARQQKQTEFGYGILTADRYVANMQQLAGLDLCYRYASKANVSYQDVMEKAARTLVYSNSDMTVQEKQVVIPDEVKLPKNTLMVFKHVLTTPRVDRDGDVLRTQGAMIDPKMLLLWQHVHTLPIGKMLYVVEHNEKQLVLVSCIVDMNELSHDAAVMVDNDMARFSHGFRALEYQQMKAEEGETSSGGFDITKFEIMEESIVSVPSNADAEQQEILLSLVEGGKLTSGLMKECGKTIREKRPVTIAAGIELKEEGQSDDETGTESEATDTTSEETKADAEQDACCQEEAEVSEMTEVASSQVEEKGGRMLSARNLATLKECLDDMDELLEKGYDMTRGGVAICERVQRKLASVVDAAGGNEEQEEKQPEAVLEEKQITIKEATSVLLANATREQRTKLIQILTTLNEAENRSKRMHQWNAFVKR